MFLGFDSFEGLPENWNAINPQGSYSTGGGAGETTRCSPVIVA